MTARPLIHVAGPAGAGKTTFIERLFEAEVAFAICVRGQRVAKLRKEHESAPRANAELRRYRAAGAAGVALYRFAEPSTDAFFMSDVMQDYSDAVFIEGDCPIEHVDLSVFVAPVPPKGRSLLRRVMRQRDTGPHTSIEQLAQALDSTESLARLLGAGLGEPFVAMAVKHPRMLDDLRRELKTKLGSAGRVRPAAATEHWAIEPRYEGIERAQLVIVNARTAAERRAAEGLIAQVTRLRTDQQVHDDVMGQRGSKVPITAVVADLSNPKDAALKKAVVRVKRVMK